MEDITKFLECKRVAFVGVSRDPQHFSRALFREFLAKGYDPVPVNPQATEIEGRKCFARLSDITPPVEAALLMTGAPDATDQAVRECRQADIRNIWIYKSVQRRRRPRAGDGILPLARFRRCRRLLPVHVSSPPGAGPPGPPIPHEGGGKLPTLTLLRPGPEAIPP